MNSNLALRAQTMTTVEIAELTNKLHKHVMEDFRKMCNELNILAADFSATRIVRGKEEVMFVLPKKLVQNLITGYSAVLRAKVLDRLEELEAGIQMDPEQMLLASIQYLQNKVIAAEALAEAERSKKLFQVSPALASATAKIGVEKRRANKAEEKVEQLESTLNQSRQGMKFTDVATALVAGGLIKKGSRVQDLFNVLPAGLFDGTPNSKGPFPASALAIERGLLVSYHNPHANAMQSRVTEIGLKAITQFFIKQKQLLA